MPQHPQRFWLAAFIVAWAVDFFFWGKSLGISYPIFIALALLAGFILAYTESIRPARRSLALGGLVLLLALVTVLRNEPFTRWFNGLLALCGLGLLALTFRSGAWIRFGLFEYFFSGFELLIAGVSRAAGLPLIPKQEQGKAGRQVWKQSAPVLRGLLIAAPVVLIMGSLLASADMIFADQLKQIFSLFNLNRLPEYLFRLFYILLLAYAFTGIYLTALLPKLIFIREKSQPAAGAVSPGEEPTQSEEGAGSKAAVPNNGLRFMGAMETFIVLGSVNLLFAFFVTIQFRYFFGGKANIFVEGFSYSEYARRGFFELVAVAVLSLLMYLILNAITRREKAAQEHTFTALSVLLVLLVGVILVSAWQRLMLYENAYGFTSLRTYTHIFIPWLGFLLLATIALQIMRREQYFGGLLLLTTLGFALTFPLVNVDGLIAHNNIERSIANEGVDLDAQYLLSLSDDALPALVEGFQRTGPTTTSHHDLGGVLACRVYAIGSEEAQPAWQSYLPARALARQQLVGLDLSGYSIQPIQGGYPSVSLDGFGKLYCAPVRSQE